MWILLTFVILTVMIRLIIIQHRMIKGLAKEILKLNEMMDIKKYDILPVWIDEKHILTSFYKDARKMTIGKHN